MPQADLISFRIRVPPELHAWLNSTARANRRSMTAEVLFQLEAARAAAVAPARRKAPAAGQGMKAQPAAG